MNSELKKKNQIDPGSKGLPKNYPVPPPDDDLLFYIQRNQNQDTIVYKLNRNPDGLINRDLPMHAYWIKYTEGGIKRELNPIQTKLAFGYESKEISKDLYSFKFVSYQELTFYIAKKGDSDQYQVILDINGKRMHLSNIYAYAVEFGVFPDVKFIEFYGQNPEMDLPSYEKIMLS